MKNYSIISGWLITLFLLLTTTTGQAGPSSEQPQDVKTDSTLIELKPLGKDEAVDVTISIGIKPMMGMLYQKYERNENTTITKISDIIPIFRGGVSLHYKKFFSDLYYQKSDKGYKINSFHTNVQNTPGFDTEQRSEFKRKDKAISVGCQLPCGLPLPSDSLLSRFFHLWGGEFAIFGGYKVGQIDIHRRDELFNVSGDAPGIAHLQKYESHFQTKGQSVGAFYVLPIGDTANIRINGAWAWLTGTYTGQRDEDGKGFKGANLEPSPTTGWTLGVEWNHYLSSHLKYSLGIDYFKYTMNMTMPTSEYFIIDVNGKITGNKITIPSHPLSITEDLATLKAALVYEF